MKTESPASQTTKIFLDTPQMAYLARRYGLDICWERTKSVINGVQRCTYSQFVEPNEDYTLEEIISIINNAESQA